MAQNYYQKEIETMPLEEMRKLQSEKLVKQVKHVYENVAYYRDLMDKKGVTPDDIQKLAVPVLAHRLVVSSEARFSGRTAASVLQEVIALTEIPPSTEEMFSGR